MELAIRSLSELNKLYMIKLKALISPYIRALVFMPGRLIFALPGLFQIDLLGMSAYLLITMVFVLEKLPEFSL